MTRKTERLRGVREGREQFAVLRERWPQAFPQRAHLVRPLSSEITAEISEAMGWSIPYTRSALSVWKRQDIYCSAVLRYNERVRLDGSVSEQSVSDDARAAAKARLEQIAAGKVAKAARAARLQEKQRQESGQTA